MVWRRPSRRILFVLVRRFDLTDVGEPPTDGRHPVDHHRRRRRALRAGPGPVGGVKLVRASRAAPAPSRRRAGQADGPGAGRPSRSACRHGPGRWRPRLAGLAAGSGQPRLHHRRPVAPQVAATSGAAVVAVSVKRAAAGVVGPGPMDALYGAIVREPILANEPVTSAKLVRGGEGGFMAVVLRPGMRAIAVPVSTATAAGGLHPARRPGRCPAESPGGGRPSRPAGGSSLFVRLSSLGARWPRSCSGTSGCWRSTRPPRPPRTRRP